MQSDSKMVDSPPPSKNGLPTLSWADAGILAGAVLGILMGLSILNVQIAAAVGILILSFVVFKLFTTKP